jgi:hypothetical protein
LQGVQTLLESEHSTER